MLGARLVAGWPGDYAGYIGTGQQVDTLRGAALALDWLEEVAPGSGLAGMDPQAFRDHGLYVRLMQEVEAKGGGMNVSFLSMLPRALAAPEYRLPDYRRWLDGANRGSGPMWAEYLERDLIAEVPVMPVPMLLISGGVRLEHAGPVGAGMVRNGRGPSGQADRGVRRIGPRAVSHRNGQLRRDGAQLRRPDRPAARQALRAMTRAVPAARTTSSATAIQSGRRPAAPSPGIRGRRPKVVFDAAWKTCTTIRLPPLSSQSQV